jgi:carboxyl-terminal processing protease
MHDAGRATLVGEQSYGKGSVQGIFRLTTAPVGISLTTAKWYTPNNTSVSQRGVTPDLSVTPTHIMARPTSDGQIASQADDAILAAALGRARGDSRLSRLSTASK